MSGLVKKNILGVGITDASKENILQYIITSLNTAKDSYYIVTPNPEMLVLSAKNSSFRQMLNQARIALPDGVGITFAARLQGKELHQRITGTDFLGLLCKEIEGKPITVGFLGGREGVAEKTAECLMSAYPGLNVIFAAPEWGEEGFEFVGKNYEREGKKLTKNQGQKTIDILFIAFGFPKQEEWMAEHLGKIPVKIMIGVGGAFDYISGYVSRAPFFLRAIGLEWLYRLIRQPWRWKRQLVLIRFSLLVLQDHFSPGDH